MIPYILEKLNGASLDLIDSAADKLGLGSIALTVGATISQEVGQSSWVITDYALLISGIGGILFIIEKLVVIYIRVRQLKHLERKDKKSRKLPK